MSLITTLDEFRAGLPVSVTATIELLAAPIDTAERRHIVPLLGRPQYDELRTAYEAGSLSTEQAELLRLVQVALANVAYAPYITVAQLTIDDSGIRIQSDENHKTAFQWQINDLKRHLLETGFQALDDVLAYLDEHQAKFPTWGSSEAYTTNKRLLLNSAADFDQYYRIGGSRRTFLALLPILQREEVFSLEPVLSAEFCAALRAEIRTGTVSDDTAAALRLLHPALAHLTMAQAVGELSFRLNGDALELQVYRADNANEKESDPGLTELLALKRSQALDNGREYLRQLLAYLNARASATVYPAFFTSACYTAPAGTTPATQPAGRRRIYSAT